MGPPVRTDESIITTCSRLGPSCLIALNPVTELHQWAAWTACEGNPKHDRPFLDLSMAQLSIHAKIHSPICPNWFFDPMGGVESCDLNRSHHFIKKTYWYEICLAQAQKYLNITLSLDHCWHQKKYPIYDISVDENQILTSVMSFYHTPSGRNCVCLFCKYNTFRCMKMLSFWSQKKIAVIRKDFSIFAFLSASTAKWL